MTIYDDRPSARVAGPGHLAKEGKAIILGAAVGLALGISASILTPASFDDESDDIFTAPHPTPSPPETGLLASLDWASPPETMPALDSWEPDSEPGWPGVALAAGDLWALETVSDGDAAILYLLSPRGHRLALTALPGATNLAGWDHDAGLAYADGPDGPMVIDLRSYRRALIPFDSEWDLGSENDQSAHPLGTTVGGEVVWQLFGDVDGPGRWDPVTGWDTSPLEADGTCYASLGPSDWVFCGEFASNTPSVVNVVTHERVELPGSSGEWLTTNSPSLVLWFDADTIIKLPFGDEGWMGYSAPDFGIGRVIDPEDLPIVIPEEHPRHQYPGTPLVATVSTDLTVRIASLGVMTTEGYVEIVALPPEWSFPLRQDLVPFETHPGVYLFGNASPYSDLVFAIDANTGEVFDYGFLNQPRMDWEDRFDFEVRHVVYIAPTEGDAADG